MKKISYPKLLLTVFVAITGICVIFPGSAEAAFAGLCESSLKLGDWCCAKDHPPKSIECDWDYGVLKITSGCEEGEDWSTVSCKPSLKSVEEDWTEKQITLVKHLKGIAELSESVQKLNYFRCDQTLTVADVHGYIYSIIEPIVYSGMGVIDLERPLVLFDIVENARVDFDQILKEAPDYREYLKNNTILIPNLKLSASPGKLIFLGDYFDKGPFPVESFYLLVDLHNQQNAFRKDLRPLVTLLGNHETDILMNPTEPGIRNVDPSYQNGGLRQRLFNSLHKYVHAGKFRQNYFDGKLMYQHSFLTLDFIGALMDRISYEGQQDTDEYDILKYFHDQTLAIFVKGEIPRLRDSIATIEVNCRLQKEYAPILQGFTYLNEEWSSLVKQERINLNNQKEKLLQYEKILRRLEKSPKISKADHFLKIRKLSEFLNCLYKDNWSDIRDEFESLNGPFWARVKAQNWSFPIANVPTLIGHNTVREPGEPGVQSETSEIWQASNVPCTSQSISRIHFLDVANHFVGTTIHLIAGEQGEILHYTFGKLSKESSPQKKHKPIQKVRKSNLAFD